MDVEILVPLGFFAAIVWLVKIISDNRLKRKVLDQHVSDELAETILRQGESTAPSTLSALKWGLVLAAIGIAFVFVQLLSIDVDDPIAYGLLFLGAGGGLVAYYLIAAQREEEPRRDDTFVPDFPGEEQ